MTKRIWTIGETITKGKLDTLLQDLKDEPLYGGVESLDNTDTEVGDSTFLAVLDSDKNDVEITLPEATGSGRLLAFLLVGDGHGALIVAYGDDNINVTHHSIELDADYEIALIIDAVDGRWIALVGSAYLV